MLNSGYEIYNNFQPIYTVRIIMLNKHQRIPKGQSKMDNPEKLATQTKTKKALTQHNMCWTPLCTNKHK